MSYQGELEEEESHEEFLNKLHMIDLENIRADVPDIDTLREQNVELAELIEKSKVHLQRAVFCAHQKTALERQIAELQANLQAESARKMELQNRNNELEAKTANMQYQYNLFDWARQALKFVAYNDSHQPPPPPPQHPQPQQPPQLPQPPQPHQVQWNPWPQVHHHCHPYIVHHGPPLHGPPPHGPPPHGPPPHGPPLHGPVPWHQPPPPGYHEAARQHNHHQNRRRRQADLARNAHAPVANVRASPALSPANSVSPDGVVNNANALSPPPRAPSA